MRLSAEDLAVQDFDILVRVESGEYEPKTKKEKQRLLKAFQRCVYPLQVNPTPEQLELRKELEEALK